jgi:hypothetical protein
MDVQLRWVKQQYRHIRLYHPSKSAIAEHHIQLQNTGILAKASRCLPFLWISDGSLSYTPYRNVNSLSPRIWCSLSFILSLVTFLVRTFLCNYPHYWPSFFLLLFVPLTFSCLVHWPFCNPVPLSAYLLSSSPASSVLSMLCFTLQALYPTTLPVPSASVASHFSSFYTLVCLVCFILDPILLLSLYLRIFFTFYPIYGYCLPWP